MHPSIHQSIKHLSIYSASLQYKFGGTLTSEKSYTLVSSWLKQLMGDWVTGMGTRRWSSRSKPSAPETKTLALPAEMRRWYVSNLIHVELSVRGSSLFHVTDPVQKSTFCTFFSLTLLIVRSYHDSLQCSMILKSLDLHHVNGNYSNN